MFSYFSYIMKKHLFAKGVPWPNACHPNTPLTSADPLICDFIFINEHRTRAESRAVKVRRTRYSNKPEKNIRLELDRSRHQR